jgi:biotin synthase-related radical SAM superfamily protein
LGAVTGSENSTTLKLGQRGCSFTIRVDKPVFGINDVRYEMRDAKGTLRRGCESHITDPISHINNTMPELRDADVG